MFENLTEKLETVFKSLKGRARIDEESLRLALKDVRIALLEADVNFKVVKEFIADVQSRAIGQEVIESINPGHQVVKIVHDRLADLMGSDSAHLALANYHPAVIMLVGLQGSGKTTTAAKLASMLSRDTRRVMMASVDVYRPAAVEQLKILAERTDCGFFEGDTGEQPVAIAVNAVEAARREGFDTVIIDTAGRLHVDEELMAELESIHNTIRPAESILVADAMTGQDAVHVAESFTARLHLDGVILTKMDGDARGGAALSLTKVTGTPIKFIGVGEKMDDLEEFHPERMASRILGMGDIVSLVEKAQSAVDERAARDLEERLKKDAFSLDDLKNQLRQIRKMGSLQDIIGMIPGVSKMKALKNIQIDDGELIKTGAIIDSMTKDERNDHRIINGRRRLRIARGSGTTVQDVNRLLKRYADMKKMMKKMNKKGMKSLIKGNSFFS